MDDIKNFVDFYNGINTDDYIDRGSSLIYHYTSAAGFLGIINSGKLRFTDRSYLNDSSEGIYVLQLCIQVIDSFDFLDDKFKSVFREKCEKRIKNPQYDDFYIYQCSFSTDKDSLCLWNYYTKSEGIKGYNLEFNTDKLEDGIKPTLCKENKVPRLHFGKVIYNEEEQIKILKNIIRLFYQYSENDNVSGEHFICDYLIDKIMSLGVFFKAPCFSVENEFRLVFNLFLNEDGKYAIIKDKQEFCEKNGVFVPFVDIEFESDILTGIAISPTVDYDSTKESILRMTNSRYKNIKSETIYKSQIPVRY